MILFSRPADRSLQAFKIWMQSMTYPLYSQTRKTISTQPWIDEATWVDNWRKFWAKVDGTSKSQRPGAA